MMVSLWTASADTHPECPLKVPMHLPPKGPQYDGLVRAADDGILVDGEGFYPTRIPSDASPFAPSYGD